MKFMDIIPTSCSHDDILKQDMVDFGEMML